MSDDSLDVYTFFDSKTWGVFYGYNQVIIILTIVISSYFLTKTIKLEYSSYKFKNDIHQKLEYVSIAIHGLNKKYKHGMYNNKKDRNSKSFNKIKNITPEMVLETIDLKFNEMQQLLENHKNQLKNNVIQMIHKQQQNSKLHNDNHTHTATDTELILATVMSGQQTELDLVKHCSYDLPHDDDEKSKTTVLPTANTNSVISEKVAINSVISDYVAYEISKHELNTKQRKGLKKFLKILWDIRKIMFMTFNHVFDTASDVALAAEWYTLYKKQYNDDTGMFLNEYNIDMRAMFLCCVSIMFYYRVASSWEIYKFSHSFSDVFFQFFFDFYLIKLIYVNVFKMKSYSPLKILKIMRSIEGQNESGFQSILTMVFLIKTNFGQFDDGSSASTIPILSFLFSFWSLASRFIFLDFKDLKPNAQTVGINIKDFDFSDINIWNIFHVVFRLIEVLFSILMISLIWVVFGGMWLVVVIIVWYLSLILQFQLLGFGFVPFQNSFLAKLMVFNIREIRIGFNLKEYIPYSRYTTCCARILFAFLGCWLLFVRVLLCCLISVRYNYHDHNDTTALAIIGLISLSVVWFVMFFVAIQFFVNRNHSIALSTTTNQLNGFDLLKSNDKESIIFCKKLAIDIFTRQNYKQYDHSVNRANNVLDAMIISNDIENYSLVQEWYDSCVKHKMNCDFDHFLTDPTHVPWNANMIEKLVHNNDSLDYYILIHDKLGLNLSLIHPEMRRNILHSVAWHGRNVKIVEWILNGDIIHQLNAVDIYGWTSLHYLIDYVVNQYNKTAGKILIHKSSLENQRKIGKLLISCGIDPNVKDKYGYTAKAYLDKMQSGLYECLFCDALT